MARLMEKGELPRVEEWKQATLEYKASSIPLGVIEDQPSDAVFKRAQSAPAPLPDEVLPRGVLTAAAIPSFHYENSEYWFRLNAYYQPDPQPTASSPNSVLPPARQLVLYRNYNDFYDFQINLLNQFPLEAGRNANGEEEESNRILPYMPGPAEFVDDIVTAHRRKELDDYLNQLCALSESAEYILRCDLIRMFFSPRAGDLMEPVEDQVQSSPLEQPAAYKNGTHDLEKDFEGLRVDAGDEGRSREASKSDYGGDDDDRVSSRFRAQPNRYSDRGSTGGTQPGTSRSASPRPADDEYDHAYPPASGQDSPYAGSSGFYPSLPPAAHPQSKVHHRSQSHTHHPIPTHPYQSQHSRSRSNTSSPMPQTPPSSTATPAPAFLKIKIFHSNTDDLIAIRVPPRVTFVQLLSKVRERLGADVMSLRYRDSVGGSGSGEWCEINGDEDLKDWVGKGDKLVLYAD